MNYKEYIPSPIFQDYIKCYYIYESNTGLISDDKAFATGCMEMMFSLEGEKWQTQVNGSFIDAPVIELWGQIINPLAFRTPSKTKMLGIRFLPYGASVFIDEELKLFNNAVSDFTLLQNGPARELHNKILDAGTTAQQIEIVEEFLLNKLMHSEKRLTKFKLIKSVIADITRKDFFANIDSVASKYGISSRYLQKIFVEYTGLTPKLFSQIDRFQKSLLLIAKENASLTSIAYESGYFDQAHFIREFKSFTNLTPSEFSPVANESAILASANR